MMKKITLLLILLTVSFGYAQILPFNFDSPDQAFEGRDGATSGIVDDSGNNVLLLDGTTTAAASSCWDNAQIGFSQVIDLAGTDAQRTVSFRIKSVQGADGVVRNMGVQFFGGPSPGNSETRFTIPGNNDVWEDVDVIMPPGQFTRMLFFIDMQVDPNAACNGIQSIYYVDDVTTGASYLPPSCTDGIQNGDETGVDCGGSCPDACFVEPIQSPDPTVSAGAEDANVLSIFNDAGDYTNNYTTDFAFGEEFRTILDLDEGAGVNEAVKLNLNQGSWGAGNNTVVNITSAGYTHYNFSYYMPSLAPGTEGHLLQATLVSKSPGQMGQDPDAVYNITETVGAPNSNAVLEFDQWVSVSIPLTEFTNFQTHLLLFKFGTPSTAFSPLVYIDNVFFSKSEVTLSSEDFTKTSFRTYPNPTQDSWTIETQNVRIASITVYDVLGKSVMAIEPNENRAVINGSSLKSGLYFAKVETAEGVSSLKLIKK